MGRKRTEAEWETWEFPLESKFQDFLMNRKTGRLQHIDGGYFFKIADRFTTGISDIIGVYNGTFIAIELKVGYNKPALLQKIFIETVARCGGVAGVAWNWGEVKDILRRAGVEF